MIVGYAVAEQPFHVHYADARLHQRLSPTLAHLEAPARSPSLEVQVAVGRAEGLEQAPGIRPRLHAANGTTRYVAYPASGISGWIDLARGEAAWMIPDAEAIPSKEQAAPFRTILHWWLADRGLQIVHAGAVATDRGAVLLVGAGGSGKSLTAIACAAAGLQFLGDDSVLCRIDRPTVFCLYAHATVHGVDLARIPNLRVVQRPIGNEKAIVDLGCHVTGASPIRGILTPRVTGGISADVTPLDPADTLRAMMPSTMLNAPGSGADAFARLTNLARRVPGYLLNLGTDSASNVAAIRRIIEGAA